MARALMSERRIAPRSAAPVAFRLRVIPGGELSLVNISREGALVESFWRLAPGRSVALEMHDGATSLLMYAQVLRCVANPSNAYPAVAVNEN
jgi:hypothetical protein